MPKYVMTVKLGINGASVTLRNVETGRVSSGTFAGPKEEIKDLLSTFESNPELKIKYE